MAHSPVLQPFAKYFIPKILGLIWLLLALPKICLDIVKKGPLAALRRKTREQHPSILDDETLGKHGFLTLKSGVRLHYVAKGNPSDPLMLFLHGFPEFWFSWRYQIRKFSNSYRTVALDMRGYCESDKPKGIGNYAMCHLVEDVRSFITEFGYRDCVLVSHDWGGAVANSFAAEHPDMVKRLILLNICHGKAFQKCIRSSFTQFRMSWYMFVFQLPWIPENVIMQMFDYGILDEMFGAVPKGSKAAANAEEIEAYKYSMSRTGAATAMINYYRAAFMYKPLKSTMTETIAMPTLMVWGTQDMALSTPLSNMSAQYYEDFTLRHIPTAGHWVQQHEPDLVNQYIEEFLATKA